MSDLPLWPAFAKRRLVIAAERAANFAPDTLAVANRHLPFQDKISPQPDFFAAYYNRAPNRSIIILGGGPYWAAAPPLAASPYPVWPGFGMTTFSTPTMNHRNTPTATRTFISFGISRSLPASPGH